MVSWKENRVVGIAAVAIFVVCMAIVAVQLIRVNQPPKRKYKEIDTGKIGPGGEKIIIAVPIEKKK